MSRPAKFDAKKIADYCKTKTIHEAMRKFKCSRGTVDNACNTYDVKPLTTAGLKRAKIAGWVRDNNATVSDAASHFRVPQSEVRDACHINDVTPKAAVQPMSVTPFEVLKLLLCGYTQSEVAEAIFTSRQRIEQIQRKAEEFGLIGKGSFVTVKAGTPSERQGKRTVYLPD